MNSPAMLTLEVTSQQAGVLGSERRKTFGVEGGTIGRAAGNRWVLAEGYVSNRHASIEFSDGVFHIEDLGSTNGVFVNDRRLGLNSPCPLQSGDRIFIEPYEIVASVSTLPASMVVAATVPEPIEADPLPASDSGNWLDDLAPPLPGGSPARADRVPSLSQDPLRESVPPAQLVSIPLPPVGPVQIPPGYNPVRSTPAPPAAPAPRVEAPAGDVDLRELLVGAGLGDVPVTPEVARQFGQMLRVVVSGVLEALRARQELKGELRIKPTMIQSNRNNPLKHSTDAEDALHNLFVKRGPAYLGPVEAFEDAFRDLRDHQIAMLAGVREAFEAMFRHFDPDRLQKEFDRHTPRAKKGPLGVLQSKPDYWEFYRDWAQRLSNDPDRTYRDLFGQEFARAYEEQLDRLKAASAPAIGAAGRTGSRRRER